MERWNGWGDTKTNYPVSELAVDFLRERLGQGFQGSDAPLQQVIDSIPRSRLPYHALVKSDPIDRLGHARGQSLPDWIALRSGRIGSFPDGVAYPTSEGEVRELLNWAREMRAVVIPYGGGTSVVGHINPLPGERPVLTLNMQRMNEMLALDPESHLAVFGAGITGPGMETELNKHGLTFGHYPQSFEFSTLGGWIATRSSGQQSYYYGRIEKLFAGGRLEMPGGSLEITPIPASAAGPDLRQIILGSEGTMGVLTSATIRVRALPEADYFMAAVFHDWQSGVDAVRDLVQSKASLSMLRLSDAQETEITLILSGQDRVVAWADKILRLLRYGTGRCLLLFAVTGDKGAAVAARRQALSTIRRFKGLYTGQMVGRAWEKNRFFSPYLRNSLWDLGYAVDTLETAVPWSQVLKLKETLIQVLSKELEADDHRVLAFAHLSHVYNDGASIYVTYLFPRLPDPDENLQRWQTLKQAASRVILAHHGTISHQHGVGLDHLPYMLEEKGETGLDWLESIRTFADPGKMMNPGKLLPDRPGSN